MSYKKKLIEVSLPLEDINREAAREKSIRHGHPSTLHLWWARRPLAACRAVLFASLVDDPSEYVPALLADSAKLVAAEKDLKGRRKAWAELRATFDKARRAGMKSVPDPGSEPKLEDVIEERERERLFGIIRELVKWENSNDDRVLKKAREEILRSTDGKPPDIYDPFCGGGSIPLEAQRLGLVAHASDLNPVPVFLNKALIEIPPLFAGRPPVNPESKKRLGASGSWKGTAGLSDDVRYYGKWMRDEAERRIGDHYPKVKLSKTQGGGDAKVIAWIWARTVASPNPAAKGQHVPLVRSFRISMKPGNLAWVDPVVDSGGTSYQFQIRRDESEPRAGTVSRNGAICLLTATAIPFDYIRSEGKAGRLKDRLMAIVVEGAKGRIFLPPTEEAEAAARVLVDGDIPETELPEKALGFRVQNYGMTKHHQLFTARQLAALTTFSDLVSEARDKILHDSRDKAYADSVAVYLAFAVDKAADYWSTLCFWHNGAAHLKIVNTFGRQALQMSWDFAEGNPFSESSGNFYRFVSLIAEVLDFALRPEVAGTVHQADAASKPDDQMKKVFSTDPPYYDNIGYADLSDFFYVWLRRSLKGIYPELFTTMLTPKKQELIATPFRHDGDKKAARDFFEAGLSEVFKRMQAEQTPLFPMTVFYAFKQQETDEVDEDSSSDETTASTGWETMLGALLNAGFSVTATLPIRTELTGNLKKKVSALASSIVLACRPRSKEATVASRRDFLAALKRELPEALRDMQKGNIAPVDFAQAAIGPGMAVFSRYSSVLEADGSAVNVRTALALINNSLDEVLAEQEGEFDADTRWAVAWFDQYGFGEGAYGLAETLCTAKNTSVSGMVEAGILSVKGGKVRLLKKEELHKNWNPSQVERLTAWEAAHQLSRALDQGERGAANLLKHLGLIAEAARDLSYRLYTICERRKWSQDAIAYNALVLSWPDLKRLADEQEERNPAQGELI